jgi:hypothetical protein
MGKASSRPLRRTIGSKLLRRENSFIGFFYFLVAAASGSIVTFVAMSGSAFFDAQQYDISDITALLQGTAEKTPTPVLKANNLTISSFSPTSMGQDSSRQIQESISATGIHIVAPPQEKSFLEVAIPTETDKVAGQMQLPACLDNNATCTRPGCVREECRPWGHWYHTMYQQRLGRYSLPGTEPFQFLEIGFVSLFYVIDGYCLHLSRASILISKSCCCMQYKGFGHETYASFFSEVQGAELHAIEISCMDGWRFGNFANKSKHYEILRKKNLLHCGDASDVQWLSDVYTKHMRRPDAPPLKFVVDDASHLSRHMVKSMFFWFPRIEPGGMLIVEDIQPIKDANRFRTQFLPQVMSDLHFCGDPNEPHDELCFPTLSPYLQSIHCEMHICVFERNQKPADPGLSLEASKPPPNALDLTKCYTFANGFGS